mmetsp:Transcript_135840/g.421981  ORF Transcript_135840/g.421981 Transcript_135840/m.421981 type:complete len:206 (+) Transcript_135840:1068-1685(+)
MAAAGAGSAWSRRATGCRRCRGRRRGSRRCRHDLRPELRPTGAAARRQRGGRRAERRGGAAVGGGANGLDLGAFLGRASAGLGARGGRAGRTSGQGARQELGEGDRHGLRERAGRAGPFGLLGPPGVLQGRRCRGLQAPAHRGDQARPHLHVRLHRVHRARVRALPRLPVPVPGAEVHRRAQRPRRLLQGAPPRVAADPVLRGRH